MTDQSSIFCWKPIFRRGSRFFSSIREESSPMARYRLSMSFRTSSERSLTAISLFRTPESMATPCSVKAKGGADVFLFDAVTNCDRFIRTSSAVNWNMKSSGNRLIFRLTDWFNTLVSTWYSLASQKRIPSQAANDRIE